MKSVGSSALTRAICLVVLAVLTSRGTAQAPKNIPRFTGTDSSPGVSPFAPERWSIVGVKIHNPTDAPVDVLSAHYFNSRPNLQFARQLWVPPHAVRSSWYPILP